MPEAPELEVVREVLARRVVGLLIEGVQAPRALVLRCLVPEGTPEVLVGRRIETVERLGKFILLYLSEGLVLAVNPMLTGRLQLAPAGSRRPPKTFLILRLTGQMELRYYDEKTMGMIYLVEADRLAAIPRLRDQGPDAFDPSLTLEAFRERLRRHYGEIKGILTGGEVVAGIGNAYADDLLFEAGIYPFRRRRDLTEAEVAALFTAIRAVLPAARDLVRQRMGDEIHLKPRDFLNVHGKGGEPCPRCGERIAAITANQRVTNFCRRCQPGVLVQKGRRLPSRAGAEDRAVSGDQAAEGPGPTTARGRALTWAEWQSLRPKRTGRPQRGRAARGRGEKPA